MGRQDVAGMSHCLSVLVLHPHQLEVNCAREWGHAGSHMGKDRTKHEHTWTNYGR
jgi:hypothetical protein